MFTCYETAFPLINAPLDGDAAAWHKPDYKIINSNGISTLLPRFLMLFVLMTSSWLIVLPPLPLSLFSPLSSGRAYSVLVPSSHQAAVRPRQISSRQKKRRLILLGKSRHRAHCWYRSCTIYTSTPTMRLANGLCTIRV